MFLDVNDKNQVDNPNVLEVDLGIDNRKMLIFSGIARPEFLVNDDGHSYNDTAVINLRRPVLAVEQYTVSIGLASIGNAETLFLIAADTATVEIDDLSQEVILKVALVLKGEGTFIARLNSCGVQVNFLVITLVNFYSRMVVVTEKKRLKSTLTKNKKVVSQILTTF